MRLLIGLLAVAAFGQVTQIPGIVAPSGGAIGGASSVAAGQVLYGTGAGVAGSEAGFAYDAATNQLSLTQAGSTAALLVRDGTNPQIRITDSTLSFKAQVVGGAVALIGTESNHPFGFYMNNVERARFAPTTGNLLVGLGVDDGTNRLQVAGSVRAHDLNILDPTATIGATLVNIGTDGSAVSPTTARLIVRAGAGQGGTDLTTWQNAAGAALSFVSPAGLFRAPGFGDVGEAVNLGAVGLSLRSTSRVGFTSTGSWFDTVDTALARNSSTAIEVNNGTAGTFRDLLVRGIRANPNPVANLPAAAGNTGMRATVTDATVTTIGTTVVGGGANTVLVWSNGTNWRIYAN